MKTSGIRNKTMLQAVIRNTIDDRIYQNRMIQIIRSKEFK